MSMLIKYNEYTLLIMIPMNNQINKWTGCLGHPIVFFSFPLREKLYWLLYPMATFEWNSKYIAE